MSSSREGVGSGVTGVEMARAEGAASREPTAAPHAAATQPARAPTRAGALAQELGLLSALWRREMFHLVRERSRWLGVVVQPLLFWLILGSGLSNSFRLSGGGDTDYLQYFFPGVVVMIVLFTAIFSTITVIEDRRSGFLQGVLVAPGSRLSLVLGKVSGVTTLAMIQAALFIAVSPAAGISPSDVSWAALPVVIALTAAGWTTLTLAMAWVMPSTQAYHAVMSVILLPLWVMSGAMFPPGHGWVATVIALNPMSYAVSAVRHALGGAGAAASMELSMAVLVGVALAGLCLTAWLTRRGPR